MVLCVVVSRIQWQPATTRCILKVCVFVCVCVCLFVCMSGPASFFREEISNAIHVLPCPTLFFPEIVWKIRCSKFIVMNCSSWLIRYTVSLTGTPCFITVWHGDLNPLSPSLQNPGHCRSEVLCLSCWLDSQSFSSHLRLTCCSNLM